MHEDLAMNRFLIIILLTATSLSYAQEKTALQCDGEMKIGMDNVDTNGGISITLETKADGTKELTIMNTAFLVEESQTEYAIYSHNNPYGSAGSLNRHTLALAWVLPNFNDSEALSFFGDCQILGNPKI